MSTHLFFDMAQLKRCGRNVIVGKTVRIRYPELVEIGDNVIIDDFTYISVSMTLASDIHIAAGCKIIGGQKAHFRMSSFSTLAPNVVLACGSDDYIGGLASPMVPMQFKGNVQIGTIELGKHCIVGANSTVLPNVVFEDGAALGANSLANAHLLGWALYAGVPAKRLRDRDQAQILSFESEFEAQRGSQHE